MGVAAYNRGSRVISDSIPNAGAVAVNHPAAEPLPVIPKPFSIGEIVYCNVRAIRGQKNIITAVKKGYIKVRGFSAWCPESNFQREEIES